MKEMKNRLVHWSDRLGMFLMCILMADACIFGGGRIIEVGSFGFRMVLLFALLLVTLPLMFSRIRELLHNKYVLVLLLFAVWLVISTIIGIKNDNNREILASDLKGFAYFVFLPAAICLLRNKDRVHLLMKVMMYSAAALALIHVAYFIFHLTQPDWYASLLAYGLDHKFTRVGAISQKIPRLFFMSELYLLCGCAFSLYFFVKEKKKMWYPVIVGLCLFALLMSYTRSVYLAVLFAAVGCVLTLWMGTPARLRKDLFVALILSVVVFFIVIAIFSVSQKTNYLGFALSRASVSFENVEGNSGLVGELSAVELEQQLKSGQIHYSEITGEDSSQLAESTETTSEETINGEQGQKEFFLALTQVSDKLRGETIANLIYNIMKSPIIGLGLGKALEVRIGRGIGYNEYFYLDLWSKAGLIGLVLNILPALIMFTDSIRYRKRRDMTCPAIWLCVLIGFMVFSFFNPYMNASPGILLYCCAIGAFSMSQNTDESKAVNNPG